MTRTTPTLFLLLALAAFPTGAEEIQTSGTPAAKTADSSPIAAAVASVASRAPVEVGVGASIGDAAALTAPHPTRTVDEADADEASSDLDGADEPEIQQEIQAESAELEELRQAEEKAKVLEPMQADDSALRSSARLGFESPLRLRLRDAFGREIAPSAPQEQGGRIALLPQLGHDLRQLQSEYDIPVEVNQDVAAYVRFFQTEPARSHFVRWLERSHRYLDRYREIMREHGIPEDTVYLAMIESGFANLAYSRAKASGPWQFIGSTGKRMGLKQDFWVDERRDPEKAAHAAAKYLRELFGQTGDWRLAWAGYNAGVGKIFRARRAGQTDFWAMTRGRVLRRETKGYVPKLMAAAIVAKHPEAFGFMPDEIDPESWIDYEQVTISEAVELGAVARAARVPERTVLELNPELRRSCTPPHAYQIKLPKGTSETFSQNWPEVEKSARVSFAHHRVQRGEGLAAIAAAYGVSAGTIVKMNGLRAGRRIRPGTELVIPLSALARRAGAPPTEVAARTRIHELQRRNPELVEHPPEPRAPVAVVTAEPSGRMRAKVQVQEGDSLWVIAQRFGVGVTELCRWNNIRNPRRKKLQIGQELVVFPRASGGSSPAHAGERS
jgi:membrane-bound lytic murein transglycosylase D